MSVLSSYDTEGMNGTRRYTRVFLVGHLGGMFSEKYFGEKAAFAKASTLLIAILICIRIGTFMKMLIIKSSVR